MNTIGLVGTTLSEIEALKECLKTLRSSFHSNNDVWMNELSKANTIKQNLEKLRIQLQSPQVKTDVKQRIKKWKQKKESRIKRKNNERQSRENSLQRQKQKHDEIDNWRNNIIKKTLDEKEKAQMKLEADGILEEVRRKITEAKKIIQKMTILQKLRQARKENWLKKSIPINPNSDEIFEKETEKITKIMEERLEIYFKEERTLQVMLKSEKDEESHRLQLEKDEIGSKLWEKSTKAIKDALFSPEDEHFICGDYSSYYVPSQMATLYSIRSTWDQYLVSSQQEEEQERSISSIPIGWIIPKQPSSSTWELALEIDNEDKVVT